MDFKEKQVFDRMTSDAPGAYDRKGCTKFRCNLLNLPKDFYNVTRDINDQPLSLGKSFVVKITCNAN